MSVRERVNKFKHLRNRHLICVLEHPKLSVNLAAVIRNVSALGVEKIYLVGGYDGIPKSFVESRNSRHLLHASVGASKWTFIRHFDTTAKCIEHLRSNGYTIAVTSPHIKGKENTELYNGVYTHKKLSVWFGNESRGISEEAERLSDFCIQIPMGGMVESLNLGTSTGIVLSYVRHKRLEFKRLRETST